VCDVWSLAAAGGRHREGLMDSFSNMKYLWLSILNFEIIFFLTITIVLATFISNFFLSSNPVRGSLDKKAEEGATFS
jgi:hypothetical protein